MYHRHFNSLRTCLRSSSLSTHLFNPLLQRSFSTYNPSMVRNCAIIAHVDHGKTTLMDKLLEACGSAGAIERAMDSNDQEKERGITITSKYTRLHYKDYMLHLVDTPGHADFSGEVERILSMVDGVILLVDASEGPMSQTKFVLTKALGCGKKAIVVLNKVDRETHRAEEVQNEIFDLFCNLTEKEEQLDYPLLFASARNGWATESLASIPGTNVNPLLDRILSHFPAPCTSEAIEKPFSLSVNTISGDSYLGRIVTGKVESGTVSIGDSIHVLSRDGTQLGVDTKVTKLFYLQGLERVYVDQAYAGQIISLAGCHAGVADTVCNPELTSPVYTPPISPPVISMTFGPNSSPFVGREGTKLTSALIKDRLQREVENNVTLSLRQGPNMESLDVLGRGELQIGILIETLRREGFELTVSPPSVLSIVDPEDGVEKEPWEEVVVDIAPDLQGMVIESMSNRGGTMIEFKDIGDRSRMTYHVPSRGYMGFRQELTNATRGNVTINSIFSHYDQVPKNQLIGLKKGKLVSTASGKTTSYALQMTEERGSLFISPGEEVYEGMVIGEHARPSELEVNPCKLKRLTNVRSTEKEEAVKLTPPRRMGVEDLISYMDDDEVLEITPVSVRLRKRCLDPQERAKMIKVAKQKAMATEK
jgi:GTP-binding protein